MVAYGSLPHDIFLYVFHFLTQRNKGDQADPSCSNVDGVDLLSLCPEEATASFPSARLVDVHAEAVRLQECPPKPRESHPLLILKKHISSRSQTSQWALSLFFLWGNSLHEP